jgi:putative tryptophan/tyrosine transport system substrate-binding protein
MRRRDLVLLATVAMMVKPSLARGQQKAPSAKIGYLGAANVTEAVGAFYGEMIRLGYVEGQNFAVVFHAFGEDPAKLPALAADLARARVDVIVADGSEAPLRAVRAATDGIPIVVVAVNYDPLERGYVESLAHPGGNITGVFFRSLEVVPKQVELLRAMLPEATRLGILYGAETEDEFAVAESSAKAQGLTVSPVKLGDPPYDFDTVFRRVVQDEPQIMLVLSTPAFAAHRNEVVAAALRYRLPAMFRFRSYVQDGGLMSYGADNAAARRLAASYVAKILGGARPADLPIQRADKFELVINVKTAKTLGIAIPPLMLTRADEVIE